jgi:predicted nucleic acid-binding Zn ribbon protein
VSGVVPPRRRRSRLPHPDIEPDGDPAVPIGSAVGHLLSARGLQAAGYLAAVAGEWESIVGTEVARHVVPTAYRGRELVVDVDEPAWSTEVHFQEALILARCREHLGDSAPQSLHVRIRRPGTLPP